MLDIDAAIKHCLEVVDKSEIDVITYKNCKEVKTNMYEKLTAEKAESDCRECAADHRQLATWLTELKELREKVSGGDVLRICQLEEREKEYKRLLKAVAKIAKNLPCDDDNCGECVHNDNGYVCSEYECFEWRYADEAERILKGE